jgi:hypothetical protein
MQRGNGFNHIETLWRKRSRIQEHFEYQTAGVVWEDKTLKNERLFPVKQIYFDIFKPISNCKNLFLNPIKKN